MAHTEDTPYGSPNLIYVEQLYQDFLENPESVDPQWRSYFHNFTEDPAIISMEDDNEQTGTYDLHVHADPHPIIHKISDDKPGSNGQVLTFLSRVAMFSDFSDRDLQLLANITEELRLSAGHFLCREGQTSNDLFCILEGEVSIIKKGKFITWLTPGEMVGELAVFDKRPRSADIVCKTNCLLLCIKRADLLRLLKENVDLSVSLIRALSSRLRDAGNLQEQVDGMVRAFRERGHSIADLDPLGLQKRELSSLTLEHYGFSEKDLDTKFAVTIGDEPSGRSLRNIFETLHNIYCKAIGAQFMHIDDSKTQEWLRIRLEEGEGHITLSHDKQLKILKKLTDAKVFESFLHKKFVGAKRFSLEGGESLIPLLDYAIEEAGRHQIDEVVIGMAHRGRLNVLVNIMDKPAGQVFREFLDVDPELHRGKGDVKYHLGYGCNRTTECGRKVHLSLCFNPSHLEFVGPVALGRTRAKQNRFGDESRSRALPLLIHGDAAFIGQGVIQEMFNLSELPGYTTGGTVHVVLNNQIGFTTDPWDSRSSQYSTDIARMLQIPIFHVNGEHPEAVAHVIRLAMDFRQQFQKDVVIDMYCYRRYGHNEGDDPTFTQPQVYEAIKKRKSVREAYVENLLKLKGHITAEDANAIKKESTAQLEKEYENSRHSDYEYEHISAGKGFWAPYRGGEEGKVKSVKTAISEEDVVSLLKAISEIPPEFNAHPKIKRFLKGQLAMAAGEQPLNWGAGEALALASLLYEGKPVRITGQDVERGTFSHRHAVWHDHKDGTLYTPLRSVCRDEATLEMYNSPLSETAVLGFEYGYSLDMPLGLTVWEAQFGDFCNVAQVIIDQFITSSEEKWKRLSGLCMFLPHGFEGQGPEHSSARLERFLMLAAAHNIQVVNMTTPAQLFHCLRRQVLRPLRKPLIVMSPKSLLRHPKAVSKLDAFSNGHFQKVIGDRGDLVAEEVKRILLCSGKLYYELAEKREQDNIKNVAILRVEQYYPTPDKELEESLAQYPKGTPVFWVQEEPLNMGAWPFWRLHFGHEIKGNGIHSFERITRPEAASPATGSAASHKIEQEKLIHDAFFLGET